MAASGLLVVSAVLAVALFQGEWLTADQIEQMPVDQLAERLLPANLAPTVVHKRVRRDQMLPGNPIVSVEFETRPVPMGSDLCGRERHFVSLLESGQGAVKRMDPPDRVNSYPQLALAPLCVFSEPANFAQVQPADELEGATKALRWLSWARDLASGRQALPFDLKCRSELSPNPCVRGARRALARLPLEKAFIIERDREAGLSVWRFAITETEPGQLLWDVKVDRRGSKPIVQMTWKAPAPF